jgi:hypothetical protein
VLVPALTVLITADADGVVVAGGQFKYTIVATNNGQAAYDSASISDSLADLVDDAAFNQDANSTSGAVSVTDGVLGWTGPLAIGQTVIITFSVTVDNPDNAGNGQLANVVTSTTLANNCPAGSGDARCSTSITVDAQSISLTDVPTGFTLAGEPYETVTSDGVVAMTVTTNSPTGFLVTLQPVSTVFDSTTADGETIPISALKVRQTGTSSFTALSSEALTTYLQTGPSTPGGVAVSNDFQMVIPFVPPGTYTATLDYLVAIRP